MGPAHTSRHHFLLLKVSVYNFNIEYAKKVKETALDQIGKLFKTTNHCEFSLAKNNFMTFEAGFAVAKKSPYIESINKQLVYI